MFAKLFSAVTGIEMPTRKFLEAGDRIHVLERYMNTREGITRKDDVLPDRFIKEAREEDSKQRTVPLDQMLDKYYKLRGYDANGIPTAATLKKLGIQT
jgi:aldehyde:ferredoxin oxidoreductase